MGSVRGLVENFYGDGPRLIVWYGDLIARLLFLRQDRGDIDGPLPGLPSSYTSVSVPSDLQVGSEIEVKRDIGARQYSEFWQVEHLQVR